MKWGRGGSAKPETEWGSAVGDCPFFGWSNHLHRLALIQIKLAPVAGLIGKLYRDQA